MNAGAAYVFRMDPDSQMWLLEQKLLPAKPSPGAAFGWTVSLDGDTALIGAYSANGNVVSSGAAYIFTYDGEQWTEQQKLAASDGISQDKFGWSVSLAKHVRRSGAMSRSSGLGSMRIRSRKMDRRTCFATTPTRAFGMSSKSSCQRNRGALARPSPFIMILSSSAQIETHRLGRGQSGPLRLVGLDLGRCRDHRG